MTACRQVTIKRKETAGEKKTRRKERGRGWATEVEVLLAEGKTCKQKQRLGMRVSCLCGFTASYFAVLFAVLALSIRLTGLFTISCVLAAPYSIGHVFSVVGPGGKRQAAKRPQ